MELPTETIEHDGTEYTISFEWGVECDNCGHVTKTASRSDRISCGDCKHKNPRENITGKYYDVYLKYTLFNGEEQSTGEVIQRLKAEADKYRAMQANGWEFNCTTASSHVALSKGDVPPIEIHA